MRCMGGWVGAVLLTASVLPMVAHGAEQAANAAAKVQAVPLVDRPSTSGRAQREMQVLDLPEQGLEIWREKEPSLWLASTVGKKGDPNNPRTLTLSTPEKVYPPTVFVITSLEHVQPRMFDEPFAQGLLTAIAGKYGPPSGALQFAAQTYGVLQGYQTVIGVPAWNGEPARDVLIFVGREPGKWPVLLQAQTLEDQLPHASEFIRRGWTNIRYLP